MQRSIASKVALKMKGMLGKIAFLAVLSALAWAVGAPSFLHVARAAVLTNISDTMTDTNMSHLSKHVISFDTGTTTIAGQTWVIQLDRDTHLFQEAYSAATTTDITISGMTHVASLGVCPGSGDNVYVTGNYNDGVNENLTITVCPGNSVAPGTKVVTVGAASTLLWTNPVTAGSYRITIGGTTPDTGETRIVIISSVVVTASVDTVFTFTIAGLASTSPAVNGETLTRDSSTTTLPFGQLAPNVAQVMGQELRVVTNARNGFIVTVVENQPLTSGTGATIDLFKDGATTTIPTAWTQPLNTLDVVSTYGHFGITSNDDDLNVDHPSPANVFGSGTPLWAGNIDTPRLIFAHNGPSDGTTQNKGTAKVAYKVEIGSLQEAGSDYNNTLTYVATPTF